jgi:spore germination protein YaaH
MPTFLTYIVATGDTLSSIARRFETTVDSIAAWNRDTYPSLDPASEGYAPDRIAVGWTLVLIPGVELDISELPERSATPAPSPSVPTPSASPTGG